MYAELGVSEYWRYDSTGGNFHGEPLVGERLVDSEYLRFELRFEDDGRVWSHSDALNLDLWWTDGNLRFWDPVTGKWLLSQEEERAGRLAAEVLVEEERTSRLAAEARLAEMEAEVRRLRGE